MSDTIKSVKELFNEKFFVPKYQRGYRWEKNQVEDLLNDINRFKVNENAWYCLQPLVVKRVNDRWNVVDGQQRLTTISLIIYYLDENPNISLEYETRKGWEKAMENAAFAEDNIDFFHIHQAYQTIKTWFDDKLKINSKIKISIDNKLKSHCKFIWFDMDESCWIKDYREEDLFLDLNKGKIKLTNAELVKALFLNKGNFKSDDKDTVRRRQEEISMEWDQIEELFHSDNDELWDFVNGENAEKGSRIELLLDMRANKHGSEEDDNQETYKFFQRKFEEITDTDQYEDCIVKEWNEIKNIADKIRYWYSDKVLYHKIGYILYWNKKHTEKIKKLNEIIEKSKQTRIKFREYLDTQIRDIIDWDGSELSKGEDDWKIRRILMLHNILTMNNQKNETARFSFKSYISQKYDLEHINPTAEEAPQKEEEKKDWVTEEEKYVRDSQLKDEMQKFNQFGDTDKEKDAFKSLYDKVTNYYIANQSDKIDNDDMSNLVLLDSRTNRGYKNRSFSRKRKFLFEKEFEGRFIPVCTKKAFNKQYTQQIIPNMTYWSDDDKTAYLKDLKEVLKAYIKN